MHDIVCQSFGRENAFTTNQIVLSNENPEGNVKHILNLKQGVETKFLGNVNVY